MGAKIKTAALVGVDAVIVDAEAEADCGKRRFTIVGLADSVVKEAKERVRCAINSSGFPFPAGDVVVSLAPAWLPKVGSGFDLAIAAAILSAIGIIPRERAEQAVLLGELALDGEIRPVRGAIQTAIAVRKLAARVGRNLELLVAPQNSAESACIDGATVIPAQTLLDAALYLRGEIEVAPAVSAAEEPWTESFGPTFVDVIGQHRAKRVMQIGAAGGHNLLMIGPPGAGKSMLASRYPALLPELSLADSIEVTKIAAVAQSDDFSGGRAESTAAGAGGRRRWGLVRKRPFRSPHHSASVAGLVGGGPQSMPGEVTLAHRGVLFLDELSEFRREVLESLRQPLEAKRVVVSRARLRITYPSDFLLIAAMNPCPCGRRGIEGGGCRCSEQHLRSFFRRLSGPILDRIDLQIWVPPLPPSELIAAADKDCTPELVAGVKAARRRQADRFQCETRLNSSMTAVEMKRWSSLDPAGRREIERASTKKLLSARAVAKTIKTARTIADLDCAESVGVEHVLEALSYRLHELTDG